MTGISRREILKRSLLGGLALRYGSRPPSAATEVIPPAAAISGAQPLTASGGLCAPLSPYFELIHLKAPDARPVRDALTAFNADRGGIRFGEAA